MKPSFLSSTLSLAFIMCVTTVIAMIFLRIDMPNYGSEVVVGIVTAYLTARWVNQKTEKEHTEEKKDTTLILQD
jgi:prolipoprotein diacylglyceryltransferase